MKRINIEYDDSNSTYYFICPFCNKKVEVNDGEKCEHVLFAYEDVNLAPLYIRNDLYEAFYDVVSSKRIDFINGIYELWDDYKPCDRRSQDPDEWDSERDNLISTYIEEHLSLDDFNKIIKYTEYANKVNEMYDAQTEPGFSYGQTHYILGEI